MKKVFVTVISILCIILVGCSGNNNPPVGTSDDNYEIIISDVIQVYVWKDNQIVPQLVNDKGEVIDARYDYVSSSDDITISFDGHITINSIPEGDVTVTITERNTGVQKNITLQFIADIQKVNAVSKETGEVVTELNGLSYNSKTTLNVITDQTDIDISSFCDITCTDKNGNEVSGFDIEYNKNHILLTATGLGEGTLKIQISNSKGENLYQTSIPFSINWDEIALQNCVLNSVEKTLLSKEDITSIKSITIDEQVKLLLEVEHLSSLETIVIDSAEVQEFIYDSVIYNYRVKEHLYDDYYNHEFWANKQGNLIPYKNSTSENYIVYHSDRSTTMSVSLITNTLAFPVLEFDGYTNIGWKNSFDKTVEASELMTFDRGVIHLYAIWEANGNRVVFNGNGATSGNMEDQLIATDSSASLTQNSYIRAGYTFVGWATTPEGMVAYSDCASFAMDKTSVTNLYAVWMPNENGINYHANGGSGTMSVQSASTGETKALSQNQFTRSGYTFAGWSSSPTGSVEYTDQSQYTMGADSSYTLYAVWTPIQYTITYNLAGGTDMGNPEQYNIESNQITLLAPTRQGYVFAGWTNENISEPTKEVSISTGTTGNKSYTAVWAATIYYHANGGSGSMDTQTIITNSSNTNLYANSFTREGYLFDGWSLSTNGTIAYEKEAKFNCGSDGEYHLYAVWNEGTEGLSFTNTGSEYSVSNYTGTIDNVSIPPTYRGLNVISISESAFQNNLQIKSVFIANTVKIIGQNAFSGCTALESVSIPNGVTTIEQDAFKNCTMLTSITIPNSVTVINPGLLSGCSSLQSLTISFAGLKSSYYNRSMLGFVFGTTNYAGGIATKQYPSNWSDYTTYYVPSTLRTVVVTGGTIDSGSFSNCSGIENIILNVGVSNVGYRAFYNCSNLESISIGDDVTNIDQEAFYNCPKLENIDIGNNVTYIGEDAFLHTGYFDDKSNWDGDVLYIGNYLIKVNNTASAELRIKKNTKAIACYAMQGCADITSVTLPETIVSIGFCAFEECEGLTNVLYDGEVSNWCTIEFGNELSNPLYYAKALSVKDASGAYGVISEIEILDGVEKIGDYAFYNCSSIISIKVPKSIKSIGLEAFYGCRNIDAVYVCDLASWCKIEFVYSKWENYYCSANPLQYAEGLYLKNSSNEYELVTELVIPSSVTHISDYAFYGCLSIRSVTIPKSVQEIGACAFFNCRYISKVYVDDISSWCRLDFHTDASSVNNPYLTYTSTANPLYYASEMYIKNSKEQYELLTNLVIPDDIEEIMPYAFYECESLESVTISNSVTHIALRAFSQCNNLKAVNIPGTVKTIGYKAFDSCTSLETLIISNGVKEIGSQAFSGCVCLDSIYIPNSVTTIGENAFYGCAGLQSITVDSGNTNYQSISNCLINKTNKVLVLGCNNSIIPTDGSVVGVGSCSFLNCEGISSIVIPDSVTSIGSSAFKGCSNLAYLKITDNITSIGTAAFEGCTNIAEAIVPVYAISYIFKENLKTIVISDGESIKSSAFKDCSKLESVTIKNGITEIGASAFENCTKLATLVLPNTLTRIGEYAFNNCTSLKSVVIPSSVKNIYKYAFFNCSNLNSVTFEITSGWKINNSTTLSYSELSNKSTAALNLTFQYAYANWNR